MAAYYCIWLAHDRWLERRADADEARAGKAEEALGRATTHTTSEDSTVLGILSIGVPFLVAATLCALGARRTRAHALVA